MRIRDVAKIVEQMYVFYKLNAGMDNITGIEHTEEEANNMTERKHNNKQMKKAKNKPKRMNSLLFFY